MEITIYRRHTKECPQREDRYAPRCGCPLSGQFNWPHATTKFDRKRLKHGQNKWSLNARIWSEAQQNSTKLKRDLEGFIEGEPVRKLITVEAAVQNWLAFKSSNGDTIIKPELMGRKLVDWCKRNDVLLLSAITPDQAISFRLSLPFRTGDSSSLSVHWSVIGGFFNWAVGMGYISSNPIPDTRQHPQFRIRYEKPEVVPPTKEEVEKVLATATGRVKLLCQLMRESAMSLVDAQKYGMSAEECKKYGLSKPERRPIIQGTLNGEFCTTFCTRLCEMSEIC